jgi:hypothetical protein
MTDDNAGRTDDVVCERMSGMTEVCIQIFSRRQRGRPILFFAQ